MRILILGGTTEASRLAAALALRPDIEPTLSMAGRTANPVPPPIAFRIGGFGGAEGLASYLDREKIAAVVDATHPFAARISAHAVRACAQRHTPLIAFSRPAWLPGDGDVWTSVPDIGMAVKTLSARRACHVFLTTGRLDLTAFRGAPHHRYLVRTIDPPDPAETPPIAEIVLGRGPFLVKDERALMQAHGTELIVTKNSGGAASAAKLEAARQLGLPVVMVERPAIPHRPMLDDLGAVLAWIDTHVGRP